VFQISRLSDISALRYNRTEIFKMASVRRLGFMKVYLLAYLTSLSMSTAGIRYTLFRYTSVLSE